METRGAYQSKVGEVASESRPSRCKGRKADALSEQEDVVPKFGGEVKKGVRGTALLSEAPVPDCQAA